MFIQAYQSFTAQQTRCLSIAFPYKNFGIVEVTRNYYDKEEVHQPNLDCESGVTNNTFSHNGHHFHYML